jgi:type VI secretion system protein ImpF
MADGRPEPRITLSLVDRLIDQEPESSQEMPMGASEEARQMKDALCRDLTALLNTRRAQADFDPSYTESTNSLLTFGIVDFASHNLKSALNQEQVRRSVERAVRQFEPRLSRVAVTMEEPDPLRPALRFQISAVLRMETADPVFFDVTLHRESRRFAVAGTNG